MEVIKQALEQQFEYPNYPLAYKHVKDQVAIVMKSRCIVLKKMIERGEHWPQNYSKEHWNQLQDVLKQEEMILRVERMSKIQGMQKNVHRVGWIGEIGLEEWLVSLRFF